MVEVKPNHMMKSVEVFSNIIPNKEFCGFHSELLKPMSNQYINALKKNIFMSTMIAR